jgi:pimeloyl-ACP methyl ester carboxylesterase
MGRDAPQLEVTVMEGTGHCPILEHPAPCQAALVGAVTEEAGLR